jgi:hypothetical protein
MDLKLCHLFFSLLAYVTLPEFFRFMTGFTDGLDEENRITEIREFFGNGFMALKNSGGRVLSSIIG